MFICQTKGLPMESVRSVRAIAGVGLEGDRYATGAGTYSNVPNIGKPESFIRHITFICVEDIVSGNRTLVGQGLEVFTRAETRRNIVLAGDVNLAGLVGETFKFYGVMFRGFEPATPCKIPGKMTEKVGFEIAFRGHGGLRAEILTGGQLTCGMNGFVCR